MPSVYTGDGLTFAATTGDVNLPYAQDWTMEQWAFMAEQAKVNPLLAPTVSGQQIEATYQRLLAGEKLSEYDMAVALGGFWTGPIETKMTVTLEEGEQLTPEGLIGPNYLPPPTISGTIPPGPTTNQFTPVVNPTTIPIQTPNVTLIPSPPAIGGQPSIGTPVLQAPLATPNMPATNKPNVWLWVAAAVVALYFFARE